VEVTPCIIVGPSATGKSTLKHLLVHNTPKAVKTSTAAVATPEIVTVSSEQYAVGGGTSAWQLVSSDVMGRSLRARVTDKAYDKGQYPGLHRRKGTQPRQQVKLAYIPWYGKKSIGETIVEYETQSVPTKASGYSILAYTASWQNVYRCPYWNRLDAEPRLWCYKRKEVDTLMGLFLSGEDRGHAVQTIASPCRCIWCHQLFHC